MKAKWLDCDKLNYWDRNAPLPNQNQKYIPWDEAVNIVLKSYNDFSPELAEIGQKFFDNNWIDADCRPGKDSGAYSHPTVPSMHPYILMNYQGKIRDVMTLAHELGHGIHQYLAREQGALMADTPLTLAETASVFGEQLTFRSLLANETDKEQKKIMIANKVEDMLNTVVRQVAFYKYEQKIHNERKNGELSIEQINQIWLSVQTASLGPAINVDDEYYKYYWAYIPHFIHSPFYVYSYAFGDCLVNALYMLYQDQPKGFVDKYIDMLSAGGTKLHKELLQPFNFDLQKTEFWDYGLSLISEFIDMLEEE
ncbi:MAG: M3 family metallopeptidase [Pseudomonadota bacterium]